MLREIVAETPDDPTALRGLDRLRMFMGEVDQPADPAQAVKLAHGLAYMRGAATDREVLWAVGKHPSRIVRAEAIEGYLWNHNDSTEARATLLKYVQPRERIFVDRVRREPTEEAATFNRKLAAFLKAHPEAVAPAPKQIDRKGEAAKPPKENEPPAR